MALRLIGIEVVHKVFESEVNEGLGVASNTRRDVGVSVRPGTQHMQQKRRVRRMHKRVTVGRANICYCSSLQQRLSS
jgi:hypothetical protein